MIMIVMIVLSLLRVIMLWSFVRKRLLISVSLRSLSLRHVAVQDELPQWPARPGGLPAPQRENVTHLHKAHGEDRYFLPDGAQFGGSQHHLCGYCAPQPARLAHHLPLCVSPKDNLSNMLNNKCLFPTNPLISSIWFNLGFSCSPSFRLCRVCFPGTLFGGDVFKNVWSWFSALLPFII